MRFIKKYKLNEGFFKPVTAAKGEKDITNKVSRIAVEGSVKPALKKAIMTIFNTDNHIFPNFTKLLSKNIMPGWPKMQYPFCYIDFDSNYSFPNYPDIDFCSYSTRAVRDKFQFFVTDVEISTSISDPVIEINLSGIFIEHNANTTNYRYYPYILIPGSTYTFEIEKERTAISKNLQKGLLIYVNCLDAMIEDHASEKSIYDKDIKIDPNLANDITLLTKLVSEKKFKVNKIFLYKNIPNTLKTETPSFILEAQRRDKKELKYEPITYQLSSTEIHTPDCRPEIYCLPNLHFGISTPELNTEVCNPGQVSVNYFYPDCYAKGNNNINNLFDIESVASHDGIGIMYNIACVYRFSNEFKKELTKAILEQIQFFGIRNWKMNTNYGIEFRTFKKLLTDKETNLAFTFTLRFPCTLQQGLLHIHPLAANTLNNLSANDFKSILHNSATNSVKEGILVAYHGLLLMKDDVTVQNARDTVDEIIKHMEDETAGMIKSTYVSNIFRYVIESNSESDILVEMFEKELGKACVEAGKKIYQTIPK